MMNPSMIEFMEITLNMFSTHPFSLAIPFLVFIFFFRNSLFTKLSSSRGKNLPPSPPKLPIIGNLHQIGTNPHRSFQTLAQKHGKLMHLHLGSKPAIVISSKELASQALKAHDSSFCGRPKLAVGKSPLFFEGKDVLFAQYGERWRQLRGICVLHLLTGKRVKSFRGVREDEVAIMIQKIKNSSLVNLSELLFTYTNNIISKAALGKEYATGEDGNHDFEKLIRGTVDLLGKSNIEDFIPWMGWINRFNGINAKIIELSKGFNDVFERIVNEHADRLKESCIDSEKSETFKDFVDVLLEVQRSGVSSSVLGKEDIKAVIFDMFVAGTHTNHVTLEWTLTEILRHPRIMKRLQEEVRGIAGPREYVIEEDLEKLTYLKAVIKESFRLHPAVPLPVPRESLEDITFNGYEIAAKTLVFINVWAIARDPAYWKEPEKFFPERFLDSSIDFKGQNFELLPFGGGRRGCPGISFSIPGIELAVANLMYRFDWAMLNGESCESIDMSETGGSIPHKKSPIVVVPTPWVAK